MTPNMQATFAWLKEQGFMIANNTTRVVPSTIGRHTFLVHVDPNTLDCGNGKRLPYGTCIGTFNLWGVCTDWTPAGWHPRGYGAAARQLLRDTMEAELAKRGMRPLVIGQRVELHPGCDLWARGARFGTIARLGKPGYPEHVAVRMDHPSVRTLQWFTDRDRLRATPDVPHNAATEAE